jgi:hypothetical protein
MNDSPETEQETALRNQLKLRASTARVTPDPGPAIAARAQAIRVRRRRVRLGAVSAALVLVGLTGAYLVERPHNSEVAVETQQEGSQDGSTAAQSGCRLSGLCAPASVQQIALDPPVPGFELLTQNGGSAPTIAGQVRVQTILQSGSTTVTGPGGAVPRQVVIEAITGSEADINGMRDQLSTWTPATVGDRDVSISIASQTSQPGAAASSVGYLATAVSPTVYVQIRGDGLSESDLQAVAASVLLQ